MSIESDWERDGYLVLRGVLDPTTIYALKEACDHALSQWRVNSSAESEPGPWWNNDEAWVMLHLNHAKYYEGRQELLARVLNAIATPTAIDAVTRVMRDDPVFMQANYYLDPRQAFANGGHWHRDCQFFAGNDESIERRFFAEESDPPRELHMHIPLVSTRATGVVPGSHKRWDTPEQFFRRRHEAYGDFPGGIRLPMEPGDIGFFHVNSIHRGYYEVGVLRRTIAVTFGARSKYRPFDPVWWRNTRGYVASFQPWVCKPGYLAGAEPHTMRLFQRFIDTYGDQWKAENLNPEAIGPQRVEYFKLY